MSLGKCELCNRSSCECVARAQAKAEQRHKNCAWAYREIDTQSLDEASKIASNKVPE